MGQPGASQAGRLIALAGAGFFMYMGNNVLMTLLPTYMVGLGCTLAEAGLQMTVFLVVAIVLRFYLGPLADAKGNRLVMLVSAASFVVSCALLPFARSFGAILALRCIQAVGLAGFWPCASGAVARIAPEGRTGLYVGIYRFATAASLLVGPVLALAVSQEGGYDLCFWALALCAAAAFVLVALFVPTGGCRIEQMSQVRPPDVRTVLGTFWRLLSEDRVVRALVVATLAVALGYGLAMNFVVSYVAMVEADVNPGLFFTLFSAGGLLANPLLGAVADRVSWGRLVAFALGLMGAGVALICAIQVLPWVLLVAGFVAGFGSSGSSVVVIAAIARHASDDNRSSALALQQNALDLGIAVSALLFGWILTVSVLAASAAFVIQGALMLVVAIAVFFVARKAQ